MFGLIHRNVYFGETKASTGGQRAGPIGLQMKHEAGKRILPSPAPGGGTAKPGSPESSDEKTGTH